MQIIRTNKVDFNLLNIYKEIWRSKSFLLNWTKRELEIRYKGSALGIVWNYLNPLLSLGIYFFIFSRISRQTVPNYLVFLFSGMICWFFFIQVISRAPDLLITSAGLLRKVYFPQEILIISIVLSGAINYCISFFLLFVLMLVTHAPITLNLLWLPVIVALQSLFLYSCCLLLSSLGAIFRDLNQIVPTLMGLLFFLTPIIYPAEAVSQKYAWVLNSLPVANFIELYRNIIHEGTHPNWQLLLYSFGFNLILYFISHYVFQKLRYIVSDLI